MSPPEVTIETAGPVEAPRGELLRASIQSWRLRTRRELGLPASGEILSGAGHQPGFWHCGILAKFVHARRLAGRGGAVVHLVVDHDAVDPSLVALPIRPEGAPEERLERFVHRFGPVRSAVAAMAQPPFDPRPPAPPAPPALGSVAQGLERCVAELRSARQEASAAMQVAAAVSSLMHPWVGPSLRIATSTLLATSLGQALVEAMRRDPAGCARAFNESLRLAPRAARGLRIGDDPELPLWTIGSTGVRERVVASDLGRTSPSALLPRAFLVSAIMRVLCDRFVHGVGARRYERVTDAWLQGWLGVELPRFDVASATCTLPLLRETFEHRPPLGEPDRRRAWFDPESLDPDGAGSSRASADRGPGPIKKRMLERLAALPRGSIARREMYRALHALLGTLRAARAPSLRALEARLAADRERARAASIARDRTWPFVYFDASALEALVSRIGAAELSGTGRDSCASGSGR